MIKNRHRHETVIPRSYQIAQSTDDKVMNLGCIEIDVPHSHRVEEALKNMVNTSLHQYPNQMSPITLELKNALYKYTNVDSRKKKIVLTHGSDTALRCIVDSYLQRASKQDPVVIYTFQYSYPHFQAFIDMYPIDRHVDLKLLKTETNETQLDALLTALADSSQPLTRLVYLPCPAMDGTIFDIHRLGEIIKLHSDVLFIIDEAYFEYNPAHFENQNETLDHNLSTAPIADLHNLITIRTFSKCFGLASIRLGYMIGDSSMMETLENLVNTKEVTEYAKSIALAAIQNADHYVQCAKELIMVNMPMLVNQIWNARKSDGGPFFFIDFKSHMNVDRACQELLEHHNILIRNKSTEMLGCARVTIPFSKEKCRTFLKAIKQVNRYDTVIWDLDQTLRPTVHETQLSLPKTFSADIARRHFVVTNNARDSDLSMIKSSLPFVEDVWRPNLQKFEDIDERPCLCLTGPPETLSQLYDWCKKYKESPVSMDILVTDTNFTSRWTQMSELTSHVANSGPHENDDMTEFELPDIMFYAEFIQHSCKNDHWEDSGKIIYCGKDSALGVFDIVNWLHDKDVQVGNHSKINNLLVVGDSMTDWKLSKALCADFHLV